MKTLEERRAEHRIHAEELCVMEGVVSEVLHEGDDAEGVVCDLQYISVNTYDTSAHICIYFPGTAEATEMGLLPRFGAKWFRKVTEQGPYYETTISKEEHKLYITIYPEEKGTCRIVPVQTGRIRKERKYIDYDVPEIEYLIDCQDEPEGKEAT